MSRSYKKNKINKIKGLDASTYWRRVRGAVKNFLRSNDVEELNEKVLPAPKEIVNDYNYVDHIFVCNNKCKHCENNKCTRK